MPSRTFKCSYCSCFCYQKHLSAIKENSNIYKLTSRVLTTHQDVNKQNIRVRMWGRGAQERQRKKTSVRKGGGLWEDGGGKKETGKQHPDHMHHRQREYSCLLGALDEMGLGLSTCSCTSSPNCKLNTPPTHNKAPLSSPLFLLSAMLPNTYSVTHSLLARLLPAHWLPSTEQQCMKHSAHHELNSRPDMGR